MDIDWPYLIDANKEWIVPVLSSLCGGVVAGLFTLFDVNKSHQHDLQKKKKNTTITLEEFITH